MSFSKKHFPLLAITDFVEIGLGRLLWHDSDHVCIPIATHNRWDILVGRTLPALLRQTHSNITIIVVFDGTEHYRDLQLLERMDARIRAVELKKQPRYPVDPKDRWFVAGFDARNRGARKCQRGWTFWMSDDDEILPHAIATLLEEARKSGAESVSGAYWRGSGRSEAVLPSEDRGNFGLPVNGPNSWLVRSYIGRCKWNGKSYKKNWNRPSDYDLIARLLKRNVKFSHTDEVVAVQHEVATNGKLGWRGSVAEIAQDLDP